MAVREESIFELHASLIGSPTTSAPKGACLARRSNPAANDYRSRRRQGDDPTRSRTRLRRRRGRSGGRGARRARTRAHIGT